MKTILLRVLLILLCVTPALAQENASAQVPTREQVQQFLDLMQIRQRMVQLIDGMKAGQKKGAEAGFKHSIPDATPEQLAKVDALADETFRDFPIDEMVDAMVPIYQRHLTKTDLEAVITFYKSSAGQKILKEQPAMMAEGMQAGQDIMIKRLPAILDRLNTQIAKLADEEKKRPTTEKN